MAGVPLEAGRNTEAIVTTALQESATQTGCSENRKDVPVPAKNQEAGENRGKARGCISHKFIGNIEEYDFHQQVNSFLGIVGTRL